MNGFGAALTRAMCDSAARMTAPDERHLESDRIRRELNQLYFVLGRRKTDLENMARLIGMLEEKIRDRQDRLATLAGLR